MKKNLILLTFAVAAIAFYGCQPEPDAAKLIDQLAVATNYDPDANFSSYTTYALPTDTIGLISNTTNDTIIVANESNFPRPVLNAVRQDMNARGYVEVARDQDPDIGMNVLVVNDFNVFQQVVYPSYGYPGNYYSGYWGYSSWYYYPYINTYAYNTGVLIIEMVDLKNRTPDGKVRVVWDAYMGDLYSTLDRIPQTVDGVHQAFNQSSYLGK